MPVPIRLRDMPTGGRGKWGRQGSERASLSCLLHTFSFYLSPFHFRASCSHLHAVAVLTKENCGSGKPVVSQGPGLQISNAAWECLWEAGRHLVASPGAECGWWSQPQGIQRVSEFWYLSPNSIQTPNMHGFEECIVQTHLILARSLFKPLTTLNLIRKSRGHWRHLIKGIGLLLRLHDLGFRREFHWLCSDVK